MKAVYAIAVAAIVTVIAALILKRRRSEVPGESAPTQEPKQEQRTEDGNSVVEEWGKESFPASDAPQAW